jgi:hypothetical protein
MFNFTFLGIRISVGSDVGRNTSWNQVNNMIMISSRWETFGSIKYLGILVKGLLEIWRDD